MSAPAKTAIVVGVDHRIQYTNADCGQEWTTDIRALEEHLVGIATKLDADLVAEEFNEECVKRNAATGCTVRDAARRAGRAHLFCDPDTAERTRAGISTPGQREEEWLRRALKAGPSRLLFVCGDAHVDSLADRLLAAGYQVTVDSRNWGNDWAFKN